MRASFPFAILLVLVIPSICYSATINVPVDQPTIQAGIDAALNGDLVLVNRGTYIENIDFKGKAITVKSTDGPKVTIIDGGSPINPFYGSVVSFKNGEKLNSILDGFTLTKGTGTNVISFWCGGGVFCENSSPSIINNIIIENSSDNCGGGIYSKIGDPVISNNIITGNTTKQVGGGIYCHGSPTIVNNLIYNNSALDKWSSGGGLVCLNGFACLINNTIYGNSAYWGGGIYCDYFSEPNIINSILWENSATYGSEIYLVAYHSNPSILTISYSNLKGGKNSVFVDPNCILNWGAGMIDVDPIFADEVNGDFHLTWNSPCKDTGDNSVSNLPKVDFETDPRISYNTVDMGADEFHRHLYATGNNSPGGTVKINLIGSPWLPAWLYFSIYIQNPPIQSPYGEWYLAWPFLGPFVTTIPQTGVCKIPFIVPHAFPSPIDVYLQSFVGPQFTNLCTLWIE